MFFLIFLAWMAFDLAAPAMPGAATLDLEEEPEVVHPRRGPGDERLVAPDPVPAPPHLTPAPQDSRAARVRLRHHVLRVRLVAGSPSMARARLRASASAPSPAEDH